MTTQRPNPTKLTPGAAFLVALCVAGCTATSESKVAVNVGSRFYSNRNTPGREIPTGGVEYATREPNGWGYEFGGTWSTKTHQGSTVAERLDVGELYVGPRYTWSYQGGGIQPWLSGGGSLVRTEAEGLGGVPTPDQSTLDPGLYFGAGVDWVLGRTFFVGVGARYVFTTARFDGVSIDGDAFVPVLRFGGWF